MPRTDVDSATRTARPARPRIRPGCLPACTHDGARVAAAGGAADFTELIGDLHARREWLAAAQPSSHPLVFGYLRHSWHDREAQSWATAQIEAEAALAWRELGLRPAEAAELQNAGRLPEEVGALWRRSGIPAAEIADWIGAGLTPEEALDQRANGVTREEAAVMRSLRSVGRRWPASCPGRHACGPAGASIVC
jgi:hypothetical protein